MARLGQKQVTPGHPAHQSLTLIAQAAEEAKSLFATVLRAGRESEQNRAVGDLLDFVTAQKALLEIGLPSNVTLDVDGTAALRTDMREGDLTDLLLVLVSNAVDAYEGRAGQIRISIDRYSGTASIALTVSDEGIGMSPDAVERAFEPFFTTKEVGRGTGLGLFVVQGIASNAGGRVEIDSRVGTGTSVRVILPRMAE